MPSRPRSGASSRPFLRRFFDPSDVRSQVEALFKWPLAGPRGEEREAARDGELDAKIFPLGDEERPE